jgi:hypothetical protein
MPIEANGKIGPIRISGEAGYWFTNKNVPSSWIRGVIVRHEFKKKTEVDLELYDQDAQGGLPLNLEPVNQHSASAFTLRLAKKDRSGCSGWWAAVLYLSLRPMASQAGSLL